MIIIILNENNIKLNDNHNKLKDEYENLKENNNKLNDDFNRLVKLKESLIIKSNKLEELKNSIDINYKHLKKKNEQKNGFKEDDLENILRYSLLFEDMNNLINDKGLLLKEENINKIKKEFKELRIAFIGNKRVGKTDFINTLFDMKLSRKSTNSFNFYYKKNNTNRCIIDTPGFNNFKYNNSNINKRRDALILKLSILVSNVIMLIINEYNDEAYNKIKLIQKILIDDNKRDHKKKYLFVIHNNYKLINDEEYNFYVDNIFKDNQNFNKNHHYYTQKLEDDKLKDSIIIYHFIMNYNVENIDQPILDKLKEQIDFIASTELIKSEDFDKMIIDNFNIFIGSLFESEKYSVKINNNLLKVTFEDKKENEIQNILKNDFEENIFFNSFQLLIPDYSFYMKDEETFILQFEVNDINVNNIKCKFNRIKHDTRYEIIFKAEKYDLDEKFHRGIYKNFRKRGFYETDVIVPLNDYSIEKLKRTIYSKGVLNFIYEIKKNNDDSDDDVVALQEEDDDEKVKVDEDDEQSLSSEEDKEKDEENEEDNSNEN